MFAPSWMPPAWEQVGVSSRSWHRSSLKCNRGSIPTVFRLWVKSRRSSHAMPERANPRRLCPLLQSRSRWILVIRKVYVQFLEATQRFAFSPDAHRPIYLASFNCAAKQGNWASISHQVGENRAGPESANLALLDALASVYGRVLQRVARYHRPLYGPPSTMSDSRVMWNILCKRCM